MKASHAVRGALVAAFAASAATAQVPTPPKITDKQPDRIVSPTPTPGFAPREFVPNQPKVAPTHPPPAPTRTPTPTPVPLVTRYTGPRWGTDQHVLPIALTRLDARSQCKTSSEFFNDGRFFAGIDCYAQGRGPLGLKADVDVAKGLRLKNGWKVKSFEISWWDGTQPVPQDSSHNWRVTKTPQVGSDDPSVSLHLYSDGFKGIFVKGGVLIEGPHGTTPW